MIDRSLLFNVKDQETLVELLKTGEDRGGLGWPVDTDEPFQLEPEIAAGVKGDGQVTVSRLIPASADERQLVLLAEFERPYIRRDLRELLSSVRRHIRTTGRFEDHTGLGDTVFIVAAPGYEDVRLVLFEEHERRLPRIRSFGWRKEFIGRTVLTHNLGRLLWNDRLRWEKAWDVEGLTDEFYTEFVKVFDAVKAATTHPGSEAHKYAYVQQLLNRLLFIAFIERMGWLKTPEGSSDYLHAQWLRYQSLDRYKEVQDKSLIPDTFIGLLNRLFFNALDDPTGVRPDGILYPLLGEVPYLNGGLFSEDAEIDVHGTTVADEAFELILGDRRPGFEGGLFRRFNFTVTESTPLDQEVAVDPEMLGKIFERIIVAEERHRTGTYYTPRPIVQFMVNEALKGYLTGRGLPADKAALLVDSDTVESETLSFKPSEMQDTLDWLFEARAVDPACGSGAYLLLLLQRLFELVDRLEVVRDKRRNPSQEHAYNTKLRLLERCVYGVDKSEVAVRIARLRLWLSLVVENKGEKPEPLPSFDFLIMCGDSLASPVKPNQHALGYPHDEIREYTRLKHRYFHPKNGETRPTREAMAEKRAAIARFFDDELSNSQLRIHATNPFDWEIEFAEVFDAQESEETVGGSLNLGAAAGRGGQGELAAVAARLPGFDIVVANPPYVNSGELLRSAGQDYKNALVMSYPNTGTGTADLLVFFLDRALMLLRPEGHLAFITSNKWLKASYGKKLKTHLATNAAVSDLINFQDGRVFQDILAYPLITIARKGRGISETRYTDIPRPERDSKTPDIAEYCKRFGHVLPQTALRTDGEWQLDSDVNTERLTKMRTRGIPLGEYVKGFTKHGILRGIPTGLNEIKIGNDGKMYGKTVPPGVRVIRKEGVFVIDGAKRKELIDEDGSSDKIIKPLAVGRDVQRWHINQQDRWLVFTRRGIQIDDYPAVKKHLERYQERLQPRPRNWNEDTDGEWLGRKPGNYQWYEIQDEIAYWKEFKKAKIVYPDMGGEIRGTLSPPEQHLSNTVYLIACDDLFLLGVLNSSSFHVQLDSLLNANLGDTKRAFTDRMALALIPLASDLDKTKIKVAVSSILTSKQANPDVDVSELEAEIDRRVYFLYFHADEAPTYDEWMAKQEAERGTAIAEIRRLCAARESGTVEFKQSLEYVEAAGFVHVPEAQRGQRIAETQKAVVHSALKTICAFLNSRGGTLLLGVHDRGDIIGIEPDYTLCGKKQDVDGFELKLTDLLKTRMRPLPTSLNIDFVPVDGKTVCRIDVLADPRAHYLDNKLYVRFGNSTEELTGRDLEDWLRQRSLPAIAGG